MTRACAGNRTSVESQSSRADRSPRILVSPKRYRGDLNPVYYTVGHKGCRNI